MADVLGTAAAQVFSRVALVRILESLFIHAHVVNSCSVVLVPCLDALSALRVLAGIDGSGWATIHKLSLVGIITVVTVVAVVTIITITVVVIISFDRSVLLDVESRERAEGFVLAA